MKISAYLKRNRTALLLSLLCFIPGMLWVFIWDNILFDQPSSAEASRIQQIDRIKDASFVVCVSVMVFFLFRISRKKLRDTRQQYQNLFENHPQPMWIYDLDTLRFLAVNKAAIKHYGYSRDEFLSFTIMDIRPSEEVTKLETFLESYRPGSERSGIWYHRKKNGELIVVEIAANDVLFFRKPCRLVNATDITERTKREADLRKMSMVAENATNSVIILDKNSRIEWVNKSFTLLTGYILEEVIGRRPSEVLHGPETDSQVLEDIMRTISAGKRFAGEILNYRKDGSKFWLRLTVAPVFSNGVITNYVTIQTDITAIKEQNGRLRDIAFTASHGFRKPLANILGLVELIDDKPPLRELVENLRKSAEELDEEVKVIVHKTAMIDSGS